jgi:hypothetical protein
MKVLREGVEFEPVKMYKDAQDIKQQHRRAQRAARDAASCTLKVMFHPWTVV